MPPHVAPAGLDRNAQACRRAFLRHFPGGFADDLYLDWERDAKDAAHEAWRVDLTRDRMEELMDRDAHRDVAQEAVRIEGRTDLLFAFENRALADAARTPASARILAHGLHDWLYGTGGREERFARWVGAVDRAAAAVGEPRLLSWPIVTVFGMLADPEHHIFVRPSIVHRAAEAYGAPLRNSTTPTWATYERVLELAARMHRDTRDLGARDLIDVEGFVGVVGSEEYEPAE